ncbi:MAG: DUF3168 domain-containing protein [Sphingomonas sp.]|nr:DUF3168 domain-containing protein [Sphingomonas sp.]
MSAESVFQVALLARLRTDLRGRVNAVVQGPSATPPPPSPYVELGELLAGDWSTKDQPGRELRSLVLIRAPGDVPDRAQALGDAAEAALAGLGPVLGDWRLVSLILIRRRLLIERGAWLVLIEHRARLIAA